MHAGVKTDEAANSTESEDKQAPSTPSDPLNSTDNSLPQSPPNFSDNPLPNSDDIRPLDPSPSPADDPGAAAPQSNPAAKTKKVTFKTSSN